jgi:hypothetical protein
MVATGWKPGGLISVLGRFRGGWEAAPPPDLEGFYQLDLRGTDASGNFGDIPTGKGAWRGEIDTAPPRVSIQRAYVPNPQGTPFTSYAVKTEDFNLDLSRQLHLSRRPYRDSAGRAELFARALDRARQRHSRRADRYHGLHRRQRRLAGLGCQQPGGAGISGK